MSSATQVLPASVAASNAGEVGIVVGTSGAGIADLVEQAAARHSAPATVIAASSSKPVRFAMLEV